MIYTKTESYLSPQVEVKDMQSCTPLCASKSESTLSNLGSETIYSEDFI